MKAQRLLLLNSLTCALIPFSNIDIVIHLSKELTVQCAQRGEHNVCVRECWFAGQCERKLSVTTRTAVRSECFEDILKKFEWKCTYMKIHTCSPTHITYMQYVLVMFE